MDYKGLICWLVRNCEAHEFKHSLFQVQLVANTSDLDEFQHGQGSESSNGDHDGSNSDHGQEAPILEDHGGGGVDVEALIEANGRLNFDDENFRYVKKTWKFLYMKDMKQMYFFSLFCFWNGKPFMTSQI